MKTNFLTLERKKKKEKKETIFTHFINSHREIKRTSYIATDFENVMLIGRDKVYGDIFKCWDNDPNEFLIFFGTAGDEFDK